MGGYGSLVGVESEKWPRCAMHQRATGAQIAKTETFHKTLKYMLHLEFRLLSAA